MLNVRRSAALRKALRTQQRGLDRLREAAGSATGEPSRRHAALPFDVS